MRFRSLTAALLIGVAILAPRSAPAQRSPLTAAQWREDLRYLATEVPRRHKNAFHTVSRAAFDSAVAALDARIPSLARDEIIVGMMRIVAMVGDGHTNIYPTRDSVIGFHALPVALYLFSDGLHVRAARTPLAALAGAHVVSIGGQSADEAYRRARTLAGRDNEQGARFWVPHLLAIPEVLHALGLAPTADSVQLVLEVDGQRRTVWLAAQGPVEMMAGDTDKSWRHRAGWVDARDAATQRGVPEPPWLANSPDTTFALRYLPESHALYVQLNQVQPNAGQSFDEYARRFLAAVDSAPPERRVDRVVLDLRLNRGGNGDLLRPFVKAVIRSKADAPGRLLVLTGRSTFSAAQFLVDHLERWTNAVFVGEPTGSKGRMYGDSRRFTLPNSGITARVSIYYWQMWSPWDTREATAPQVGANLSMADYRRNRDAALDAALRYAPEPMPLANRIIPLLDAGDTAAAIATLRAYRAAAEHQYAVTSTAIDTIAGLFISRGQLPRAIGAAELWAREHRDDSMVHALLGELYSRGGRLAEARRALELAVQLGPSNDYAQERLKALNDRR
jgi:hypothetical protein